MVFTRSSGYWLLWPSPLNFCHKNLISISMSPNTSVARIGFEITFTRFLGYCLMWPWRPKIRMPPPPPPLTLEANQHIYERKYICDQNLVTPYLKNQWREIPFIRFFRYGVHKSQGFQDAQTHALTHALTHKRTDPNAICVRHRFSMAAEVITSELVMTSVLKTVLPSRLLLLKRVFFRVFYLLCALGPVIAVECVGRQMLCSSDTQVLRTRTNAVLISCTWTDYF